MPVNTLVITGYGTNCHKETAYAARLAGSDRVDILHFADLIESAACLENYNFIVFPGGFLDGDDLGAAQAAAGRWRYMRDKSGRPLLDSLRNFIAAGKLVLGICNGFQLLVKLGVLPALDGRLFERQVSLSHNVSARFEDRWVNLYVNRNSPCIFTKGCEKLFLPVRHGEGRLIAKNEKILTRLIEENFVPLFYADANSNKPTSTYPDNPNGSAFGIAGLCDMTGRILGLMPHPEAYIHKTNHPYWTAGKTSVPGTVLFENAIKYLRANPCD